MLVGVGGRLVGKRGEALMRMGWVRRVDESDLECMLYTPSTHLPRTVSASTYSTEPRLSRTTVEATKAPAETEEHAV